MNKLGLLLLSVFIYVQTGFAQKITSQDTVRILAIGNSFSEDALENYLYELAEAADRKIIIGNLYIGGAPLDLHVKNIQQDNANYSYRKITLDGTKTTTDKVSIAKALKDEKWTVISMQQASPLSGKYEDIMKSLPALFDYVKEHVAPTTKLAYHQTWAYQQDSKHEGFANYGKDQHSMYDSIVFASQKVAKTLPFSYVTPSGTAIQNLRTSSIGDHVTRDGYHLDESYGRFAAACTWYEKLFGLDVRKNPYQPKGIDPIHVKLAERAAHKAVRKPFKISKIR